MFFYTIVDETCSAPDVVLVAIVTGDLVHGVPPFLHLQTWIGHTSRFHTSPNVSTKRSLTFSEKRAYQYVSRTDHTPSGGLSRATALRRSVRICTRDNCPTSKTKLCLLRNAVYQITCNNCNQHYIGSTTRFIHDRVKEHLNSENSSAKKHISTCQNKD